MSVTHSRNLTRVIDSGQVCTASTRVYVEKSAAAEFRKLMIDGVRKLKQGSPSQGDVDLGPQADSVQVTNVSRFLDIGAKDGKAIVGGKPATDIGANFIQPTIFTDVPDASDINQLEIFGPVLLLHEFDTEEEAVTRANDTECKKHPSHTHHFDRNEHLDTKTCL